MAIEKDMGRKVKGADVRKALHIGLEKLLKEQIDPVSIEVLDSEVGDPENLTISCTSTGTKTRKPRTPKS